MITVGLNRKKGRKVIAIVTEARCVAPGHVTKQTPPSSLADMFGSLALVFKASVLKVDAAQPDGANQRLAYNTSSKADVYLSVFRIIPSPPRHVAAGRRNSEFEFVTQPPGAQVLAVVFDHFILSGILALEANMLI